MVLLSSLESSDPTLQITETQLAGVREQLHLGLTPSPSTRGGVCRKNNLFSPVSANSTGKLKEKWEKFSWGL